MKTGGIVLDSWKLDIFKKHLDAAGYAYEVKGQMPGDCLLLNVQFSEAGKLQTVIVAATKECERARDAARRMKLN